MGPTSFEDPRFHQGEGRPGREKRYGHPFIHELAHACQIEHSNMDTSYLADGLTARLCESYEYGRAGFDFTELALEPQASVVGDWFIGEPSNPGWVTDHTRKPVDVDSPYFRYIVENVRTGHY
jgi:hypothetical protein